MTRQALTALLVSILLVAPAMAAKKRAWWIKNPTTPAASPVYVDSIVSQAKLNTAAATLLGSPSQAEIDEYGVYYADAQDVACTGMTSNAPTALTVGGEFQVEQGVTEDAQKTALRDNAKCALHSALVLGIGVDDNQIALDTAAKDTLAAQVKLLTVDTNGWFDLLTGISGGPTGDLNQGNLSWATFGCTQLFDALTITRSAGYLSQAEIDKVTAVADTVIVPEMNAIDFKVTNWRDHGLECKIAAYNWSATSAAAVVARFDTELKALIDLVSAVPAECSFGPPELIAGHHPSDNCRTDPNYTIGADGNRGRYYGIFGGSSKVSALLRHHSATGVSLFEYGPMPEFVRFQASWILDDTIGNPVDQNDSGISPTTGFGRTMCQLGVITQNASVQAYDQGGQDVGNGDGYLCVLTPPTPRMTMPAIVSTLIVPPANTPPTVDIGTSYNVTVPTGSIAMSASVVDPDPDTLLFAWTIPTPGVACGAPATFSSASTQATDLDGVVVGAGCTVQLCVNDQVNPQVCDTATVTGAAQGANDPDFTVNVANATVQSLTQRGPKFAMQWRPADAIVHADYPAASASEVDLDAQQREEIRNIWSHCTWAGTNGPATWQHSPFANSPRNEYYGPASDFTSIHHCPTGGGDVQDTIMCTFYDSDGTWNGALGTVTCQDVENAIPASESVCVSASGDFAPCRSAARQVTSSTIDLDQLVNTDNERHVQVAQSDAYTMSAVNFNPEAPIVFEGLGSGWDSSDVNNRISVAIGGSSGTLATNQQDGSRYHNLAIVQTTAGVYPTTKFPITFGFDTNNNILSDMQYRGWSNAFFSNGSDNSVSEHVLGHNQMLDSDVRCVDPGMDAWSVWTTRWNTIIAGNYIDQQICGGLHGGSEHVARIQGAGRSMLVGNIFRNSGVRTVNGNPNVNAKESVTIRGDQGADFLGGPRTDFGVVYDNHISHTTDPDGTVSLTPILHLGPQNGLPGSGNGDHEIVSNWTIYRNLLHAAPNNSTVTVFLSMQGPGHTAIGNVALDEAGWATYGQGTVYRADKRAGAPVQTNIDDVLADGNVFYSTDAVGEPDPQNDPRLVSLLDGTRNEVANSVAYTTSAIDPKASFANGGPVQGEVLTLPLSAAASGGGLTLQSYYTSPLVGGGVKIRDTWFAIDNTVKTTEPGLNQ